MPYRTRTAQNSTQQPRSGLHQGAESEHPLLFSGPCIPFSPAQGGIGSSAAVFTLVAVLKSIPSVMINLDGC